MHTYSAVKLWSFLFFANEFQYSQQKSEKDFLYRIQKFSNIIFKMFSSVAAQMKSLNIICLYQFTRILTIFSLNPNCHISFQISQENCFDCCAYETAIGCAYGKLISFKNCKNLLCVWQDFQPKKARSPPVVSFMNRSDWCFKGINTILRYPKQSWMILLEIICGLKLDLNEICYEHNVWPWSMP